MTEGDAAGCNATVVRRAIHDIWNQGDLRLADRLFDSTYVNHGGLIPDLVRGPEAIKFSVALYRTAFPGLVITINHLEVGRELVTLLWAASMPPRDESLGARRRAQRELLAGTTYTRLVDGQIVESWTTWDRECRLNRLTKRPATRPFASRHTFPGHRVGRRRRSRWDA